MPEPKKLNLVIVDDDPAIVRLTTKYLNDAFGDRINIHSEIDSLKAHEWIDHNCCDILISDIEMPGMDGLEMLSFTKQRNAWTQVVFLTGASTWDRIATAIEHGASDYLVKPIDREDLIAVITECCQRIERWRQALRRSMKKTMVS